MCVCVCVDIFLRSVILFFFFYHAQSMLTPFLTSLYFVTLPGQMWGRDSPGCVVADVLDSEIVLSEFELH